MASYELFKNSIEQAEGEYQNLIHDKGNYNSLKQRVGTNHGISAKFYEGIIKRPPTVQDMKAITKADAHLLFETEFWDVMKADHIKNQAVAEIIVDHAINSSNRTTAGIVQNVLNASFSKNLKVDRVIGTKTITAINSVNQKQLFEEIAKERLTYYRGLDDYIYFAESWERRVFHLAKKFGVTIKENKTETTIVAVLGMATIGYLIYKNVKRKQ